MLEKVFNIFPIFNNGIIDSIGYVVHEISGTDEEKLNFLMEKVETDSKKMKIIPIPHNFTIKFPDGTITSGISYERFNDMQNNGTDGILYEIIFQFERILESPLIVTTPITDGEIKIDKVVDAKPEFKAPCITSLHEDIPEHYLEKLKRNDGFTLIDLIHEDFIGAINLTYNKGFYVSSVKLLLSSIDSIAFLEYGDIHNNFKDWLRAYCDFSNLGITEDELWEYRNSLLHMTNTQSRKVISGSVKQLKFYVSEQDQSGLFNESGTNYFNLKSLKQVVLDGMEKWAISYDENPNKLPDLYKRYDLVASDTRYSRIEL